MLNPSPITRLDLVVNCRKFEPGCMQVLDRESICSLPKKGNGYEIVEHAASTLIGNVS